MLKQVRTCRAAQSFRHNPILPRAGRRALATFTFAGKTFYGHTGGADNYGAWLAYEPEEKLVVRASEGSPEISGECFGPVSYLVSTPDAAGSVMLFRQIAGAKGALTASVYSTDEQYLAAARDAALDVGVALSENLTGGVYVNQSAAFSDFHATAANPAANAALTDGAYVASRFRIVQSRHHV